jgi:hypothetical protein
MKWMAGTEELSFTAYPVCLKMRDVLGIRHN